jgi:P-type conjugative transfer protein TrbJ
MLANQVLSLQNELRNLQNLRFDVIDEFSNNFTGLYGAIGRVDGIIQHINNLDQKFREFYPEFHTKETAEIQQSLIQMTRISREMIEGALQTGAHVIDSLPQTQAQIENLTSMSQGSVGILQATQAGNQIAGNIATQLANLNAQMATATQASSAFYMQTVQARAAEEQRHESALRDWGEPIRAVPVPRSPIW